MQRQTHSYIIRSVVTHICNIRLVALIIHLVFHAKQKQFCEYGQKMCRDESLIYCNRWLYIILEISNRERISTHVKCHQCTINRLGSD